MHTASKLLRIICILLTLLSVFVCCTAGCTPKNPNGSEPSDPENPPAPEDPDKEPDYEPGSYVQLIYMCGSSLETNGGAATKNIAEMLSADLSEGKQIVLQTGGARNWRDFDIPADMSCRYEIKDGVLTEVERNPAVNMGLGSTLSDFLTWGADTYPAERYGLILWNHGGGTIDGLCFDQQFHNDSLTLPELDVALAEGTRAIGKKFDWIGLDACLMATFETAFILEKYALNMVASQELEPAGGWNYTVLAESLGSDDFYDNLLQGYAEKSSRIAYYTLSHIDFSGFPAIVDDFYRLLEAMLADTEPNRIVKAVNYAVSFGSSSGFSYNSVVDLYDLGNLFDAYGIGTKSLSDCIDCVGSPLRKGATGLSLFFPLDSANRLDNYASCNPFERYSDYLFTFYADRENEVISFLSYATPGGENDNYMTFVLNNNSLHYVRSVEYTLYRYGNPALGEFSDDLFEIGSDNDVLLAGGNATVLFEGNWVSLGGHLLHCTILEQSNGVTLYEAPVPVGFFFATLLFSYDSRTNKTGIVGIMYEGDPGQIHELTPGTEIAVCKRKVLEDGSRRDIDSELFVYTENMAVEIGKVPDGFYQCNTYVKDIYGKQYCAGAALILIQDGNSILVATSPDDIAEEDIESSPAL